MGGQALGTIAPCARGSRTPGVARLHRGWRDALFPSQRHAALYTCTAAARIHQAPTRAMFRPAADGAVRNAAAGTMNKSHNALKLYAWWQKETARIRAGFHLSLFHTLQRLVD